MHQAENDTDLTFASGTDARWIFVSVAVVGAIGNVLSLIIMLNSKRIHTTIKTICLNIIFYDVLFLISEIIFLSITIFEHPTLKFKVSNICRNSVRTSWYLATFLSIERVIALDYPYHYRKYLTQRIVRLYMIFVFVVFMGFIAYRMIFDERGVKNAEWSVSCWTTNGFILTCGTIVICCYARVLAFTMKQIRPRQNGGKNCKVMKSTTFFLLITGSFILTHFPVVVESVILRCNVNLELHSHTFSFIILYCALNPVIYIWRFPVCRLVFLVYLKKYLKCVRIRSLEKRIVKLKIEVYDIVLAEKTPRNAVTVLQKT